MTQPHYIYNNKVYHKLQEVCSQLNNFYDFQNVHYNVYDDTFSTSAFWKEPSHSLEYYFKQRVLELKDSYNKLRLICSAGYDTYIILLQFLKYNIHLDEIVFLRTDWSETDDYYSDYEINNFMKFINSIDYCMISVCTVDAIVTLGLLRYRALSQN